MADSILKLKVESQEYDAKLKRASQGLQAYIDNCRKVGGTLSVVEDETLQFVQALGQMDTMSKGGTQSIREMTRTVTDLTLQYRSLTDEEKQSPFGQAMARSIQQLTERAGEARDAMNDVNAAIQHAASDTRVFDQIAGAAGLATASFQTLQGAAKLLGIDMGDNVEVIAKLQAAMAVTNGLTQIQNTLQQQSAVMQGMAALQTSAHAAAQALLAKNTKLATAAGEALNAVSKSNPYVLLASAIAAVISALIVYEKHQKQAAADTKLNEETMQRAKRAAEDYQSTLSSEYAQIMAKYDQLKRAWKSLSTEQEKIQWIRNNQRAFAELGISVNNLKSAEDVFEQNTASIVDSFRRRAEAAAIAANMVELYRQKMDLQQQAEDVYKQKRVQAYYTVPKEYLDQVRNTEGLRKDAEPNQWGEITYNNGRFIRGKNDTGPFTFSKEEADAYNNSLKTTDAQLKSIIAEGKQINQTIEERNQRLMELEKNTAGLSAATGVITTSTPAANIQDYPIGSLPQLTQELRDLQNEQNKALDPNMWLQYQKRIEQTQYKIAAFKGEWKDGMEATFTITTDDSKVLEAAREIEGIKIDDKSMTITADTAEAIAKVSALKGMVVQPQTVTFTTDDSAVMQEVRKIDGLTIDEKTMTVTVNTAKAYNEMRSLVHNIQNTTVTFQVTPEKAKGTSITTHAGLNSYINDLRQQIDQADLGSALYENLTSKLADATMLQNLVKEALTAGLGTALFDVADATGQDFWDRVLSPEGVENADWQAIADAINQKRKELGLDAITIDFNTGKVSGNNTSSDGSSVADVVKTSQQVVSGLSQVSGGLQQMGIKWSDGISQALNSMQGLMSVIQGVTSIITVLQSITLPAQSASTNANTIALHGMAVALSANAVSGTTQAVMQGVATMGTIMLASHGGIVPHAASGYVVGGTHYSGDTTPVLANAGEVILSRAQQGNLVSQLENTEHQGQNSSKPYVTGQEIYLGLNNFLKNSGYGELVTTLMH